MRSSIGWLTSYFCLLSFSLRSNFSASSPISHCHNSLAFSLNTIQAEVKMPSLSVTFEDESSWNPARWCHTSVCPHSGDQQWEPSCGQPGSSSSSPSQFVSWLLFCSHSVLVRLKRQMRQKQSGTYWIHPLLQLIDKQSERDGNIKLLSFETWMVMLETNGRIENKYGSDIHGPQRVNPTHFEVDLCQSFYMNYHGIC